MLAQITQYLVPPPPPWLSMAQLAADIKKAAFQPEPKVADPVAVPAPHGEPATHRVDVRI